MDASMSNMTNPAYAVEVIGFNQTERIVLSSIFGLSARRSPKFVQHTTIASSPDLYLVDAADSQAIALFKARNSSYRIPAILIGDANHGLPFPALARPLQWTKLFKAFDLAIEMRPAQAAQTPPNSAAFDTTQKNAAIPMAHVARTAPTSPPPAPATPSAPAVSRVGTQPTPTYSPVPAHPISSAPITPSVAERAANNADWVLVVDDNVTVRDFMKNKLAPFRFNVDFAASGEQAIGLTGEKSYTCVFLDVIMPGIDGYQVCKLIKSKKAAGKTAVVMLTSKSSPFDRIRGAMAGCDAYLTKPVNEDKLLETIGRFLTVSGGGS